MNLYMSEIGKTYKIISISSISEIKNEFYSNGILPGIKIQKLFKNMFDNYNAYKINKNTVVIKNEYAKYIEVIGLD